MHEKNQFNHNKSQILLTQSFDFRWDFINNNSSLNFIELTEKINDAHIVFLCEEIISKFSNNINLHPQTYSTYSFYNSFI